MMRARWTAVALAMTVSLLAITPSASAETSPDPEADASTAGAAQRSWLAQSSSAPDGVADGGRQAAPWRTLALLLFVSALGGAALYVKKRRAGAARPKPMHPIDVLGSARVGAKAQVVVTRVGERTILLGVTDQSVRRLAWLDEREHDDRLEELDEEGGIAEAVEAAPLPDAMVEQQAANDTSGSARAQTGQRFRDMLRSVIRGRSDAALPQARPAAGDDAALQIAEATRDVVTPLRGRAAKRGGQTMVNVEEQAAGLAERLAARRKASGL